MKINIVMKLWGFSLQKLANCCQSGFRPLCVLRIYSSTVLVNKLLYQQSEVLKDQQKERLAENTNTPNVFHSNRNSENGGSAA